MKIIHVGPEGKGETAQQRARAMEDLGHEVHRVFYRRQGEQPQLWLKLYRAAWRRLGYPRERWGENAALVRAVMGFLPDIVWVEKGLTIRPKSLEKIRRISPKTMLIAYSPDDMMNPDNQSRYYLACLSLYDLHVTTKTYNISELLDMGARKVEFMPNSFDPHTHRSISITESDIRVYGANVSFVGAFEQERAESMIYLAKHGIPIRIWGVMWHKLKRRHPNLHIEGRPVYNEEYAKTLCAAKINLGFLRKVNRDNQTSRSIEIPACGAFMLAERSDAHLSLFMEGSEAEFFSDNEELLRKTRYYLDHEEERVLIGRAGRERCIRSGYSYQERLTKILDRCQEMLRTISK